MKLLEIHLRNFKTFRSDDQVVPFKGKIYAVVGPNGSGKSNFLDAIALAMGAKCSELRVSKKEILDTSTDGTGMSIEVTLESADEAEIHFKRELLDSVFRYFINDDEVTSHVYMDELQKLSINVKMNNFMIFQDSIEPFFMQSPAKRTAAFELMSGSGELKREYDQLKSQLRQVQQKHEFLRNQKGSINREMKLIRLQEQEGKEYKELVEEKEKNQMTLILLNLYYGKKSIESLAEKAETIKQKIDELDIRKLSEQRILREAIDDCKAEEEKISDLDADIKRKENDLLNLKVEIEKKEYLRKRIAVCKSSLESAKQAEKTRQSSIQEIQSVLKDLEQAKKKCQFGKNIELSPAEIEEYESLQRSVFSTCATDIQAMLPLERKYNALVDIYESQKTKKNEALTSVNKKKERIEEIRKRIEKYEDAARSFRDKITAERSSSTELKNEHEEMNKELQYLTARIVEINEELGDSVDFRESQEHKRIADTLKQAFTGVYGRLSDLCRPIHSRYSVAVTRVFGKNMHAIVVDNAKTARNCIEYLKINRLGARTFLPLHELRQCDLIERFCDMKEPRNVKRVFDVMDFQRPLFDKAIFYATNNTLVCETPEDASRLVYDMSIGQNVVSLDGCYYRKSGIIQGGNLDLTEKAKVWNSQKQGSLKAEKENCVERSKKIAKSIPKKSDLELKALTIKDLEKRLKFIEDDKMKEINELDKLQRDLAPLEEELADVEENTLEAERNAEKANEKISRLKSRIESTKKKIFAQFCRRIKVDSIDEYEVGKKKYEKIRSDYDRQIACASEQLAFEMERDTYTNIHRWENHLADALEKFDAVTEEANNIENVMRELEDLQTKHRTLLTNLSAEDHKISSLRRKISAMAASHKALTSNHNKIRQLIYGKQMEYHEWLTRAKMHGNRIIISNDQSSSQSSSQSRLTDVSASIGTPNSYSESFKLDANVEIDFASLPDELQNLSDDAFSIEHQRLEAIVDELSKKIDVITGPNLNASQQLIATGRRLAETNRMLKDVKQEVKRIGNSFEFVKNERLEKFSSFFEQVSNHVDAIYKQLCGDPSAQACLILENPEEPYLGGIFYDCLVPGKRYLRSTDLSGGEKAQAALPLLFAAQKANNNQPPFQMFDEIDAALDNKNIRKLMEYLRMNTENQTIIATHKKNCFVGADVLIGITVTEENDVATSQIFTFDLSEFEI